MDGLTKKEKNNLSRLGLFELNGSLKVLHPNYLDLKYETNHFRFHYTLSESSTHKVDNIDYVIQMGHVFEQVWLFFIDTLNFESPPTDPSYENDLYDIYIENIPSYYFGITYTSNYGSNLSECSSFIKMRNNYNAPQFNEHSELENIKVTAVHEFFHSIQFSYNCFERLWVMEASAVWSEDQLYNNINDLYRYLKSWFSNSSLSIDNESNHMYGSFILFQYIDEHFGGPETIKKFWDYSKEYSSASKDISFQSLDSALDNEGISFEETYHKMTIANKILSKSVHPPYSYEEADGYKSITSGPNDKNTITFKKNETQSINNQTMNKYSTLYYSLSIEDPVNISLIKNNGDFSLSIIIKHDDIDYWTIKSGDQVNISPNIDIEWISIVISSIGYNESNWNFSILLEDGYLEDFTLAPPFPNPSIKNKIIFKLNVIEEQNIILSINDLLGRKVWSKTTNFNTPGTKDIIWDGINNQGKRISNGVYFITAKGKIMQKTHKIIFLK